MSFQRSLTAPSRIRPDEVARARRPWIVPLLALMLLVMAPGCSTFNRDWNRLAGLPAPAGSDPTGLWEGRWKSDANGHEGRLRCIVYKFSDREYETRYKATFLKILTFSYAVSMTADPVGDGAFRFTGEADLGTLAGGLYRYSGTIQGTNFFATYTSPSDHGVFTLHRLRQAARGAPAGF